MPTDLKENKISKTEGAIHKEMRSYIESVKYGEKNINNQFHSFQNISIANVFLIRKLAELTNENSELRYELKQMKEQLNHHINNHVNNYNGNIK